MEPTSDQPRQSFSFYPAIPPPLGVSLTISPEHDCPYLAERLSRSRALYAREMPAEAYQRFMDSGFRRSGRVVYQPVCAHCRECRPIRVPVETFKPNKSQRRARNRNTDLTVEIDTPAATDESFALYQQYQREWHHKADEPAADAREAFEQFLYTSPVPTLEFRYRDLSGKLLAVGICDVTPRALSSVYFYFDPASAHRGLGTFGAVYELDYARKQALRYYYLGYWVAGCAAMRYKMDYRPYEVLREDGNWASWDSAVSDLG